MSRPLALVTGASAGLGDRYARSLARRGHDLLLVARRGERLRALAAEIEEAFGACATVVPADLATEQGRRACREAIDAAGRPLELAILNAGFGSRGALHRLPREREVEMVQLNCTAVVDLACYVLPPMVERGAGALVVVSSASAWQPLPYMATYAASKAFELSFADAVGEELRGTGVQTLAVLPGPTRTEFSTTSGENAPGPEWLIPTSDPEDVVAATWRALGRGRRHASIGPVAHSAAAVARVLPRPAMLRGAGLVQRE